ncbi:MAG: hypothetical protein QNJ19_13325 [Woeseiaceae bacterium]|nr:hypothetical protein [Woeseiaceae bacterium]
MTREDWLELAKGPIDSSRIDDLEALAKAHENLAYRYRSAASLLRQRANENTALQKQPIETDNDRTDGSHNSTG